MTHSWSNFGGNSRKIAHVALSTGINSSTFFKGWGHKKTNLVSVTKSDNIFTVLLLIPNEELSNKDFWNDRQQI